METLNPFFPIADHDGDAIAARFISGLVTSQESRTEFGRLIVDEKTGGSATWHCRVPRHRGLFAGTSRASSAQAFCFLTSFDYISRRTEAKAARPKLDVLNVNYPHLSVARCPLKGTSSECL
jgi:hypothetical protein